MSERPDSDKPDDDLPPLPEPMLGSDEDGAPDFGLADEPAGERPSFLGSLETRDEPSLGPAFDEPLPPESLPIDNLPPELAAADASFAADDDAPAFAAPAETGTDVETLPGTAPITETRGRMRRVWQEIRYVAIAQEKPEIVVPPPVVDEQGRTVRKYLYEKSFDIVEAPPEPEPEPEPIPEEPIAVEFVGDEAPPPTFSEEELAAARAAGYAEGEATAQQAAAAATEARIAGTVEHLAGIIPGLAADRDQAVTAVSHEAARLAHAMVRRLMPELARRYRLEEIEAVVIDSIDKALDQPRIIIRAPADLTPYLGDRLETVARQYGFAGRVIVLADPTLGPSDVRVEWGDGGAERCVQRAWNDIEAVVARVIEKLEQVAPVADVPAGPSGDTIGSAA